MAITALVPSWNNVARPRKVILDIDHECSEFEDFVRFIYPVFEHDGYEVASTYIDALSHWEEMEQCIVACTQDYQEIYKQAPAILWQALQQFVRVVYYKLSLVTGASGWISYQSCNSIANGGGLLLELTENRKEYTDVIHSWRRQY